MYNNKINILITGANGYIGKNLIDNIIDKQSFFITALVRDKSDLANKYKCFNNIKVIEIDELFNNNILLENIDILVHLAFARRFRPNSDIADSLQFSKNIFQIAKKNKISAILNISTQGVYGNANELRNESTKVAPEMMYAMAKYANEVILESVFDNTETKICNMRLDSVAANQNLLPVFVKNAYEKGKIEIIGGKQIFSFLDVRDVVNAIIMLIKNPANQWKSIYNVGANNVIYNIKELAKVVADRMQLRFGKKVIITIEPKDIVTYAGINSTLFMKDTGWKPIYGIEDIVDSVIDEYIKKNIRGELI